MQIKFQGMNLKSTLIYSCTCINWNTKIYTFLKTLQFMSIQIEQTKSFFDKIFLILFYKYKYMYLIIQIILLTIQIHCTPKSHILNEGKIPKGE